jgi:hypothetical protein
MLDESIFPEMWLVHGRPAVIRRLAGAGLDEEAVQLCRNAVNFTVSANSSIRSRCFEAAAPVLSRETTEEFLGLTPHQPALLERQSQLGYVADALATARSLPPGASRFEAVTRCARFGSDTDVQDALTAVVADLPKIDDIDSLWRCLRLGAPQLARLPIDDRATACQLALELLGQRIRLQAVPGIYLAAPLIASVGGAEAVEESFAGVVDATRWWPVYPRIRVTEDELD